MRFSLRLRSWLSARRALLGAALAGALAACSALPAAPTWPMPLGLALWAVLLERQRRRAAEGRSWRQAAALGLAFGVGVNTVALSFVPQVIARFTPLPWPSGWLALVLLAAWQSAPWLVTALGTQWLRRRGVPLALALALSAYLGQHAPAVFPWSVAAGLAQQAWCIQAAEWLGERGVATLWTLCAGAIASTWLAWRSPRPRAAWAPALLATALPLGMWMHAQLALHRVQDERRTATLHPLALVHPAYPAPLRWEPGAHAELRERLQRLTRQAERDGAELVIWPESAHPFTLGAGARRDAPGAQSLIGFGVRGPLLAGVLRRRGERTYNSALWVHPDRRFGAAYDKRWLLAFGERVPLAEQLPWLARTFARGLGLSAGERNVLLGDGVLRAGVLICFEDTLPDAARAVFEPDAALAGGPNLLVNLTNDAWFAGTHEPELHARLAALRAVETRRELLRAVNGGVSAHFDAGGQLRARLDSDQPAVLPVQVALREGPATFYVRWGDSPLPLALLVLAIATIWRRRRAVATAPA